jgi:membrane protein YdbS with pleckstrin-like domain
MKPKQAFGLAVRIAGLIVALIGAFLLTVGLVNTAEVIFFHGYPRWQSLVFGAVFLLLGYLIIRCARHIVRFAYLDEDSDHDA